MSDLSPLLIVEDLHAYYGQSHILQGMNFEVREGEVVTLTGRNGAGKTTTIKSLMGMIAKRTGRVCFAQTEIIRMQSNHVARLGLGYCPEERGIFSSLNVLENLTLPPIVRAPGMSLDQIYELFPQLHARLKSRGTSLSGGEQQLLAIARLLRTGARLLLFDEPTEGLAPVIVQQIAQLVHRLKEQGFTILMVEQNLSFAATIADRHYIVEGGVVVDSVKKEEIALEIGRLQKYLGV